MDATTFRNSRPPIIKRTPVLTPAHYAITLVGIGLLIWIVMIAAVPMV